MSSKSKGGGTPRRAVVNFPFKVSVDMIQEQARRKLGRRWTEEEALRWVKGPGGRKVREAIEKFIPDAIGAGIAYSKSEAMRKKMDETARLAQSPIQIAQNPFLGPDGQPLS